MGSILVMDKTPSLYRLKEIALKLHLPLIETYACAQVLSKVKSSPQDIAIVIIDIMADEENCFDLIHDIKRDQPDLPVIILTSLNSRKDFVNGLRAGANDYILKPFDDDTIQNRITKLARRKDGQEPLKRSDSIDFRRYLDTEIIKSKKGHYPLSVGMVVFFKPDDDHMYTLRREYDLMTEQLFKQIRPVFFETDICMPYGTQTLMVVLPFCNKANVNIIENKVRLRGHEVMHSLGLNGYDLVSVFVTIPDEGENMDILFTHLNQRINSAIGDFQHDDKQLIEMVDPLVDPLLK